MRKDWVTVALVGLVLVYVPALLQAQPAPVYSDELMLGSAFEREVDKRLAIPQVAQQTYAQQLQKAFDAAGIAFAGPEFVIAIDRHTEVQAALLYWHRPPQDWHFVGASPVSTGRPGRVDYFFTPLGIFRHTPANPDYRAEGTKNEFGILGYGRKGMRVFDFGWQLGERGWGTGGRSQMRLQMHATDPFVLEPRLGTPQSKGCIRIPATLNRFLDHYGILDADYEEAMKAGRQFWVLPADRKPTLWSGRYLVVVESPATTRPAWSPLPRAPRTSARTDGPRVC